MRLRPRIAAVVVAALVVGSSGGCATTNGDDLGNACALAALAILSIPVAAACGTGCVVGGVSACADHNCGGGAAPDDDGARASTSQAQTAEEQPAPDASGADDAEAQRVAY